MGIKQFKHSENRIVRWRSDDSFIVKNELSDGDLTIRCLPRLIKYLEENRFIACVLDTKSKEEKYTESRRGYWVYAKTKKAPRRVLLEVMFNLNTN